MYKQRIRISACLLDLLSMYSVQHERWRIIALVWSTCLGTYRLMDKLTQSLAYEWQYTLCIQWNQNSQTHADSQYVAQKVMWHNAVNHNSVIFHVVALCPIFYVYFSCCGFVIVFCVVWVVCRMAGGDCEGAIHLEEWLGSHSMASARW